MSENFERNFRPEVLGSNGSQEESKEQESDVGSLNAQESGKQKLFIAACNERLDELVRLKMLPEKFAEDRREAASLITEGLSNNPEEDGTYFADLGTESIGLFRRGVDEAVEKLFGRVQPTLEGANTLLESLRDSNRIEDANDLELSIATIEGQLGEFQETVRKVKDLEVPFSDLLKRIISIDESAKAIST